MFFFFRKHRNKHKGNVSKDFPNGKQKKKWKSGISQEQMDAISHAVMNRKRLIIYAESF